MRKQKESVETKYTAKQMYDMVINIEQYPNFVPWCGSCKVLEELSANKWLAEMQVGFSGFKEIFKCEVEFTEASEISVKLIEGPFKTLENLWTFTDLEQGGSRVDFTIEYKFKNFILEKLASVAIGKSSDKMIQAFLDRADEVYGKI